MPYSKCSLKSALFHIRHGEVPLSQKHHLKLQTVLPVKGNPHLILQMVLLIFYALVNKNLSALLLRRRRFLGIVSRVFCASFPRFLYWSNTSCTFRLDLNIKADGSSRLKAY